MSTLKGIPDGYHSVQAYLVVKNCASAIEFYKKAFGAGERMRMAGPDGRIGHAEIQVGDSCVMMADENPQMDAYGPEHYGGSPVSLLVYVENCDAVYRQALAAGVVSLREPRDESYGARMSGILDPFGFKWWVATQIAATQKQETSRPETKTA
jgi:PhnB protein